MTVKDKIANIETLKRLQSRYNDTLIELNLCKERHKKLNSSSADYYRDAARVLSLDIPGVKTILDYGFKAKEDVIQAEIEKLESDIKDFKY